MVKSIITTFVAIALCIGFFLWTDYYIHSQFSTFHDAIETLYDKVENEEATREDAYAIRAMWEDKKRKLHIFIPHNDISYLDYWLNETCGLIYNKRYDLALGKVEVLLEITRNLPDSYTVNPENVF